MTDVTDVTDVTIPLGNIAGRRPATSIDWDPGLAEPPVLAITGREGAGKTTWLARIVKQTLPGIPTLLVADKPGAYPIGQDGLHVWEGGDLEELLAEAGTFVVVVCDTRDHDVAATLASRAASTRFVLLASWRASGPVEDVFPPLDAHTVLSVSATSPADGVRIRDLDGSAMVPIRRPGE